MILEIPSIDPYFVKDVNYYKRLAREMDKLKEKDITIKTFIEYYSSENCFLVIEITGLEETITERISFIDLLNTYETAVFSEFEDNLRDFSEVMEE